MEWWLTPISKTYISLYSEHIETKESKKKLIKMLVIVGDALKVNMYIFVLNNNIFVVIILKT